MSNGLLNICYLVAILISAAIFIRLMVKDAQKYLFSGKNLSKTEYTIGNILCYVQNNITKSGRFVYVRNLKNKYSVNKKLYDIRVHAGMIYALKLCEDTFGIVNLTELRQSAMKYFVDNYVKEIESECYAVIADGEKNDKIRLADVAMAITALATSKEFVSDKMLENFGEFLHSMQLSDGQIYDFYDLNTKTGGFDSCNSTGVAVWGLLNICDGQRKWFDYAKNGLLFFIREYKTQKTMDYYSILAVEKLLSLPENNLNDKEIALLKNYLTEIFEQFLAKESGTKLLEIAINTECLISVYNCFGDDIDFQVNLMKLIDKNIKILRMAQIQKGALKGGFPASTDWKSTGVSQSASLITMDTIQHVFLACIKFEQMFRN